MEAFDIGGVLVFDEHALDVTSEEVLVTSSSQDGLSDEVLSTTQTSEETSV